MASFFVSLPSREDTPPLQQSLTSEELHGFFTTGMEKSIPITSKGITEPHFHQYKDFCIAKNTLGSLKSITESEKKTKLF